MKIPQRIPTPASPLGRVSFGVYYSTLLCFLSFIVSIASAQKPASLAPLSEDFLLYQQSRSVSYSPAAWDRLSGVVPSPMETEVHRPDITYDRRHIERGKKSLFDARVYASASDPKYDLRDPNLDGDYSDKLLTDIRAQGSCGSCWAFATYGSLESYLKKTYDLSDVNNDYSENNLKHLHGFDYGPCAGGNEEMSTAYFARYDGPISESDDPYDESSSGPNCTACDPVRYVDNFVWMPTRSGPTDNGYIKQAILDYGALYTCYYHNDNYADAGTNSYYYDGGADTNHCIAIVGWDDNKVTAAAQDGAFICRNSWGTSWGENGYFYISYYDTRIAYEGLAHAIDEDDANFQFDTIYQYDPLGMTGNAGWDDGGDDWGANIFTPDSDGYLKAIGFYSSASGMSYEIYIYDSFNGSEFSTLLGTQTGSVTYRGYYTIQLDDPIALTSNDDFAVVIRFNTTTGTMQGYPIPVEYYHAGYSSSVNANAGESYASTDGSSFSDITTWGGDWSKANICIKAFVGSLDGPPDDVTISMECDSEPISEDAAEGLLVGEEIAIDVTATDGGAPPVTLTLVEGPTGASFSSIAGDGEFTWTPSDTQVGDFEATFRAVNNDSVVTTATATMRVSRKQRRIISDSGDFVAVGFDYRDPPRIWSQVFDPLTGARIGGGRLITEYLYLNPIYPELDRFFTMDVHNDGSNELITVLVNESIVGNKKTWVLTHNLMTGQKLMPGLRVLADAGFENPRYNDYLVADVDNDNVTEFAAVGITDLPTEPKRYFIQSWDVLNRIRVGAMEVFADLGFSFPDPTLNHYLAGDVNGAGADEILCIGVTDHTSPRTYCQCWTATSPYDHNSFQIGLSPEFDIPGLNHFLVGNVDSDANEELVAIFLNGSLMKPRVQIWAPDTGNRKDGGTDLENVLGHELFTHPEGNRFLLADGNGDGKKELLAIGTTSEIPGRIWLQRWDLESRTKIRSRPLLSNSAFVDPTISEYLVMDVDADDDDELLAVGYVASKSARWVQVWDLDPVAKLKSFIVLRNTDFIHPVLNYWTGG